MKKSSAPDKIMTTSKHAEIEKIKERLIENLSPEKIILFGSYAEGNFNENSDVDMLIILDRKLPLHGRSIMIEKLMTGIKIPTDFLVYNPAEINNFHSIKSHIIHEIISKGDVIYEK